MTVNDRTSLNVCQTTPVLAEIAVSFALTEMRKALFVKELQR